MYRLTVLYGHPDDPKAFDQYYQDKHLPLAKTMKGLKGWTLGKCESIDLDSKPPYYMIVGLFAESREALETMLETAEGKATVADLANFATGGATFMYDNEQVLLPYVVQ